MRTRHLVIRPFALLTLLLAVGLAPMAQAQDAGVRSVFAEGGGSRALGLGGAFAAIADDASALVWNPGGLAQLKRYEFQVSHATLYDGFEEQHAFLALPSWRWGVTGVSVRRYGVSGIEARDELNILVDEELSREELEFALAYGHTLGSHWSLGAAVKLQRISFGTYSGAGFGLDLGILGHPALALGVDDTWAHRMRMGISVRNVVKPSIRLDVDSVPDPTGLRLGVSYLAPLGNGPTVLFSVDLEKTQEMDTRMHAGLEARLHSLLALRGGVNAGSYSVGTSIHWRGLSVDYSLENNELDSTHRIGLSSQFGKSTDQRHAAALAKEEQVLQERLAEAFDQRQAQQVSDLVEGARTAYTEDRIDEALDILGTAELLSPGDPRVGGLTSRYLREKANQLEQEDDYAGAAAVYAKLVEYAPHDSAAVGDLDRCRAESEQRAMRSADLRQRYAAALDAFLTNDLITARDGFAELLAEAPKDKQTATMLQRTEALISERTQSLLDQARNFIRAREFDRAQELLDEVRVLDTEVDELAQVESLLVSSREAWARNNAQSPTATGHSASQGPGAGDDARTAVGSGSSETALTDAEQTELAGLYARGNRAIENGRQAEAIRYWELVWSIQPEYQQVRNNLKREYLALGMESFARRDLEQAIVRWEDALRVDPSDPRTVEYLNRARKQMTRSRAIGKQGR